MFPLTFLSRRLGQSYWSVLGFGLSLSIFVFSHFSPILQTPFAFIYHLLSPLEMTLAGWQSYPQTWIKYQQSGVSRIADLESRNAELRVRIAESEFLRQENIELKKILESMTSLQSSQFQQIAVGRVISKSGGAVTVDQGEGRGIKEGDVVMSDGALVGQVEKVSTDFSMVNTLEDGGVRFFAQTINGVSGVVVGQKNGVVFSEVPLDAKISAGDFVYSAGNQNSPIPSGLVIGQIAQINQDQNNSTLTILIEQIGRLQNSHFVVIGRKE